MSWLKDKRARLHAHLLQQKLTKQKIKRNPVSFDECRYIGLIFAASQKGHLDLVKKFAGKLEKQNRKVKVLAYFDDKEERDHYPYEFFNQKNIDLLHRPVSPKVKVFIDTSFDILINISAIPLLPLEYIAALSNAKLRIGPYTDKLYCYDLMIDTAEKNITPFINQVEYFLNILKKTKHEPSTI